MNNYVGENKQPTIILLANCSAGDFVSNGAKHGFAVTDGLQGQSIAIKTEGRFTVPKKTEAQAVGDLLCYHASNGNWQKDETADGMYRAYVNVAAGSGDATVEVALIQARLVGEQGDITGVSAGTGLTGGGTAGAVSLAVDFGTTTGKVCQGDDSRLSDDRDPNAHADSHKTAGTDALAAADIGAAAAVHGHAATEIAYANVLLPGVAEVGDALDDILDLMIGLDLVKVPITIANGQSAGSSAADPTLVGGTLISAVGSTGCEFGIMTAILNVDGSVTVTLTAAQAIGGGAVDCFVKLP